MNLFKQNEEKSPDVGNINKVARQKAERDAMPKDKDWLLQECYNHVCWHEVGNGLGMGYYLDEIDKRWRPDMSAAETEALKRELLGY